MMSEAASNYIKRQESVNGISNNKVVYLWVLWNS